MADNKSLHNALKAKKDEFYTQLDDIANELKHYKKHFAGKTIFCNCDDPYESNFFKYFAMNFNVFGLKKLICTCWDGSPITGKELDLFGGEFDDTGRSRIAYKLELTETPDLTGNGAVTLEDVQLLLKQKKPELLKGNGDFRSDECIELLKEADIVITNPPFSLFREYVAQLEKYKKKYLIIGNQNAIANKDIFPLIKENKLWLGYGFKGGATHFISHYEDVATASNHKEGMIRVSGVVWFTNLDHNKRHEPIDLYKKYSPEEYPKYDNYDAINVDKTADIPLDYDGVMGVPVTFFDKYCPEQFEIIGMAAGNSRACRFYYDVPYVQHPEDRGGCAVLNNKRQYTRILIRRRK